MEASDHESLHRKDGNEIARRDGDLDLSSRFGVRPDNYTDTKGGAGRLIGRKPGPRRRTSRRLYDSDYLGIRSFSLSLTLPPYHPTDCSTIPVPAFNFAQCVMFLLKPF
jgi:hypothetical protein